jgi:hypothetical protein
VALVCATREERLADLQLDLAAGAQRIPMRPWDATAVASPRPTSAGDDLDRGDEGPNGPR